MPLTSPFRLLITRRWPQKYSRAISANGTGFQTRFAWVLISSLFREQAPRPSSAGAEPAEQRKPDAAFATVLKSWCWIPALTRSEEHTSELQSLRHLVCRLLLEKKKKY